MSEYKKNTNKKQPQKTIKNLTKRQLLAMAGWAAPGEAPKTETQLKEIRTALSKNAVLKSKNPSLPHKITEKGAMFLDWLTLNMENRLPFDRASWFIDSNALVLQSKKKEPVFAPRTAPTLLAISGEGTFKVSDFSFKVFGASQTCEKLAKIFYKGQEWGIFEYQPRKGGVLPPEYSTLKIANEVLYQRGWAKSLVAFGRQTGCEINHVKRIDLAFDVEDSSLFYFLAMQSEGLTEYDLKGRTTTRVLTGTEGEYLQVVLGSRTKRGGLGSNRRLSCYNKTKEIAEQIREDGTEKKDYIRAAHEANGMKGQVFRYELSFTHNYLRTIDFNGKKVKKAKKGESTKTQLNIIKALNKPHKLFSLYADALQKMFYFVPKGKKALEKNKVDIIPSAVGYAKLPRVKKPKPKFLGSYLNLLRNAFKAAVTAAEPTLVRGAVRLLHSKEWLERKYHDLKERWYKEEAQKADLLGVKFRPFEEVDFHFSNVYSYPTPFHYEKI